MLALCPVIKLVCDIYMYNPCALRSQSCNICWKGAILFLRQLKVHKFCKHVERQTHG